MNTSMIGFCEDAPLFVEKSCRNPIAAEEHERKWFVELMWQAFPEATSENELAELVAEFLTKENRQIHAKTVRNWLRQDNAPHFRYVFPILSLAGVEHVLDLIYPERIE